jgi:hypothetical protein
MKRFNCLLLAASVLLMIAGCQNPTTLSENRTVTSSTTATEEVKTEPFHANYEPKDNLDFFTKPESIELLASGGPFYISPRSLPMPAFEEYNKLKQAKIDEAISITDELISRANNLSAKVRQLEMSLFAMFGIALSEDKNLANLTTGNLNERATYVAKELILQSYIKSLPLKSDEPYVLASAKYHKSMLALELGATMLDDYTSVLLNAGQLYEILQSSASDKVKAALNDFDKEMAIADNAKADIEAIIAKSNELDTALRQLATADYYLAETGVEYMKTEIPKIKAELERITPTDNVTADDIAFIKQYLASFDELTNDLVNKLAKLKDKGQILQVKDLSYLPKAHADLWGYYQSAKNSLSSAASAVGSGIVTTLDYGWSATKATVHGAQRIAGTAVEGANAITKSTFDFYAGLYYGNSLSEIRERQNQNYASWSEKTWNGTAGSDTFKLGGKILDKSEEIVSDIVTAPIRYTWGEGNVSWAVGGVSKIASGVLTSLGKGIYKLSNPESTAEDMFWGSFDVGTSLLGGSSAVLKASQVTSSGAKTGKNILEQGANYLSKILRDSKAAKLAERMEEIKDTLKQSGLADELKSALKKELKQSKYELNRLKNIAAAAEENSSTLKATLKEEAENFTNNLKATVKKNLNEQAENISKTFSEEIESSVSAYIKKFLEPIKSPAEIYNNLVHGELDKWLADQGKNFIANTLIPWLASPYDGVYKGTWKSRSVSFPVTINVNQGAVDGSASVSLGSGSVSVQATISISGTVDAFGNISGSIKQTAKINGAVQGGGSGSGSFSGKIADGQMTFNYSGSGSSTVSSQGFSKTTSGGESGTIILKKQ